MNKLDTSATGTWIPQRILGISRIPTDPTHLLFLFLLLFDIEAGRTSLLSIILRPHRRRFFLSSLHRRRRQRWLGRVGRQGGGEGGGGHGATPR